MKHQTVRTVLGLLILTFFLLQAGGFIKLGFLNKLEMMAYDARLNLTMAHTVNPDIVIVDIDEKSLAAEGRWPWGRDKVGALLDRLFDDYHVAVTGFDVVFAEKDESSGLPVLRALEKNELRDDAAFKNALKHITPQLDHDAVLAGKLKDRPVVLGYYFKFGDAAANHDSGAIPAPTVPKEMLGDLNIPSLQATGYGGNLAVLQKAAPDAGHFTPSVDFDGVTRHIPLLIDYQGGLYESLSIAVVRKFLGERDIVPVIPSAGEAVAYNSIEKIRVGALSIPVDLYINALVPYRGQRGSFTYVPATDVLQKRVSPDTLAGKIVLIGTTAPGLMDLRSTPVNSVYPGVEVHANMIAGILEQNIKYIPDYVVAVNFISILIIGLLLVWLLPRVSPLKVTLLTGGVMVLVSGGNLWAWQSANLVLPVAGVLSLIVLLYMLNMSYGFFVETRAKRQISDQFGQYIPPELVLEMSKSPADFDMKGESRELTILFSDIRGFTTLSEQLSPQDLSDFMNAYLTPMTQVIHKNRGTIDKYIGDAIMAFWGAPIPAPNHALLAVQAGLDMLVALEQINADCRRKGWPEIKIGIGLNTGVVSVGNMGSRFRKAYTVMGDAVNLASRLEGLTKQYGVSMMVGENTRHAAPELVYRELDVVRVKGKLQPVKIYEPLGGPDTLSDEEKQQLAEFQAVLEHYRAQKWDEAARQLGILLEKSPDTFLYRLYMQRIIHFQEHAPGVNWDGVFDFHEK